MKLSPEDQHLLDDASCLTTVEKLSAKEVAELRKKAGASQAVFASYLNVTTGLVSQWERGEKQLKTRHIKDVSAVSSNWKVLPEPEGYRRFTI